MNNGENNIMNGKKSGKQLRNNSEGISVLRLAPGEVEIFELLWSEGPVTLAETRKWFHERGRNLANTTLHTRLNRLVEKGLVARKSENPTLYEATICREDVSPRYYELFEEICGRNLMPFLAQLAENRDFTQEEIAFLEKLIEQQRSEKEPENE